MGENTLNVTAKSAESSIDTSDPAIVTITYENEPAKASPPVIVDSIEAVATTENSLYVVNEPFISDKWTKTTFYYNPSLKDKLEYIYTPHIEGPEEITGTWSDLYEYGHAHSFPKAPSKMELWVRVKGVEGETA